MPKTNKAKQRARRAAGAAKSTMKQFAAELTGPFHSVATADFPDVNFAALRLCALALASK